jgi:hypothetical protein
VRVYVITGGIGLAVIAVLLVLFAGMKRQESLQSCALNLRRLSMAVQTGSNPQDPRWDAVPAGRAFWAHLPSWPDKPPYPVSPSVLICPVYGKSRAGQDIDYRGPAKSYREMSPKDAVACDRSGNHGDRPVHVLLKDGSLFPVSAQSAEWSQALATTSD